MKNLDKMTNNEIENLMKEKVELFEKEWDKYNNVTPEPQVSSVEFEDVIFKLIDEIDEIIMHCVFEGINFDPFLGSRYQKTLKAFLSFYNDSGE